jgi:hypothetical protein
MQMDKDLSSSTNQAASTEVPASTKPGNLALPVRCSICYRRIWNGALLLKEPEEAPEPQQVWSLCKTCHAAVERQLLRSPLRSPLRVRVAAGLVAAERWPRARRYTGERSDRIWTAFLFWGFLGFMFLHLIIIVLLAEVFK